MTLTSEMVKQAALAAGADLCGIGDMARFEGAPKEMDPRYIFPEATRVIGLVFRIPRGVQRGIEEGTQFYQYPSMAYGGINEIYAPAVLYSLGKLIEDHGYEAAVYRNTGARGVVSDMRMRRLALSVGVPHTAGVGWRDCRRLPMLRVALGRNEMSVWRCTTLPARVGWQGDFAMLPSANGVRCLVMKSTTYWCSSMFFLLQASRAGRLPFHSQVPAKAMVCQSGEDEERRRRVSGVAASQSPVCGVYHNVT